MFKTKTHALTLLSAVLIVLSFPPFDFYPLIFFALLPWFEALKIATTPRLKLFSGIALSFYMTLGGYYWVATVLHQFAELPMPIASLGVILLGLINQPQFPILALGYFSLLEPKNPRSFVQELKAIFLFCAVYTAVDWVVPKLFVDTFGHAFYKAQWLRQNADWGGAWALTFFAILSNVLLWRFFRTKNTFTHRARYVVCFALLVATFAGYGQYRFNAIQTLQKNTARQVVAGVIQPNVGDVEKIAAETGLRAATKRVLAGLLDLSGQSLRDPNRPHFIVWPETAFPSAFRSPQTATELENEKWVEKFFKSEKVPLIFGGYDSIHGKDYNALFSLNPFRDAGLSGRDDLEAYHKHILLLFGEYIPGAETFVFIKEAFPKVGNFGRGSGPRSISVTLETPPNKPEKTVNIGPMICYEALFSWYAIYAKRAGAELLLNVTNDSWFGPFGEPYLHLALSTFRSIETHTPQLRATNTGITSLIDATGEIIEPTEIGKSLYRNYTIPIISPQKNLIDLAPLWFNWVCLILSFTAGIPVEWRHICQKIRQRLSKLRAKS